MADKKTILVQGQECEVLNEYDNGIVNIDTVGYTRVFKRGLSPRHKIINDLKALGMKNKEIAETLNGEEATTGQAGYIGMVTRSPDSLNAIDETREAIVGEAKQRLLETVPRATEVFIEAIEGGDVKAATKLLTSQGALSERHKSEGAEVAEAFGDWLIKERRKVNIDTSKDDKIIEPRRVERDVDAFEDEPREGIRLYEDTSEDG